MQNDTNERWLRIGAGVFSVVTGAVIAWNRSPEPEPSVVYAVVLVLVGVYILISAFVPVLRGPRRR